MHCLKVNYSVPVHHNKEMPSTATVCDSFLCFNSFWTTIKLLITEEFSIQCLLGGWVVDIKKKTAILFKFESTKTKVGVNVAEKYKILVLLHKSSIKILYIKVR